MTPATGVATIGFDAGETIVCTYTNTQQGSVYGHQGHGAERARRTSRSRPPTGRLPAGFSLDDDADPALSNTQLLTGLVDGQSYVVTETSAQRGRVHSDGSGVHAAAGRTPR